VYLGIEIGGTKLQLAVGQGDGTSLHELASLPVEPERGAAGILVQMEQAGAALIERWGVRGIGIGFGGPVAASAGRVIRSHQIAGWEAFPLAAWCQRVFRRPTVIGNDCNLAAVAEARWGAGQGHRRIFYVTVGTGVGGGFVLGGQLYGDDRPAVAEIGHLRPGLHDDRPETTVESLASGWGIVAAVQARLAGQISRPVETLRRDHEPDASGARWCLTSAQQVDEEFSQDLRDRCGGDLERLTARIVAQAATEGNEIAAEVLAHARQAMGWAIAQVVTLLAPEVIVVGGGVASMGEQLYLAPLRDQVRRYVFPPLVDSYQLVASPLGELVVPHGALGLARQRLEEEQPQA